MLPECALCGANWRVCRRAAARARGQVRSYDCEVSHILDCCRCGATHPTAHVCPCHHPDTLSLPVQHDIFPPCLLQSENEIFKGMLAAAVFLVPHWMDHAIIMAIQYLPGRACSLGRCGVGCARCVIGVHGNCLRRQSWQASWSQDESPEKQLRALK